MTDRVGSLAYQFKIIATILKNKEFLEQIYDIVKPEYFEESQEWIVSKILWYFDKYKNSPTQEVFKQEIDKLGDNTKKIAIIESLKNIYRALESSDLEYIQTQFLEFCKQQAMKNAILESVDYLKSNNYDKIKNIVDKALKAGVEKNIGHRWNDELKNRTTDTFRTTIPLPWPCINNITDGGASGGELFCIIGAVGGGKSWLLCSIGSHAAKQGKTVAHYTLELSEKYTGLRYDSLISGIEPTKIKHNYNLVKEKLEEIPGKIIIKEFPTKSISYHAIAAHITQMTRVGNKPDLVIVDYADLLHSSERSDAKYQELGMIYEDLRRLAGENKVPVFTCSQAQRSATDEIIEGDKIAESYSKLFTADFCMSMQRNKNNKIANTAKIYVIKNRMGADGIVYEAEFDTSRAKIEIYESNSPQGLAIIERTKNNTLDTKEIMRKKLKEYNTDTMDLG